jgi:COP9 signalosome complex subunit 12
VINLLFKTYFRLNQASLSKNVLRVLLAGRGDMPELAAFPKSQQCTFKYYEGVLSFLEEHYVDVSQAKTGTRLTLEAMLTEGRPRSI